MYDRVVDVPRLLAHYGAGEDAAAPALTGVREQLSDHYEPELGERFVTSGLCLYRDGRDSVAWHGDRIGRGRTTDTWSRSCPSASRGGSSCARTRTRSPRWPG